jgi:hypothetical protein
VHHQPLLPSPLPAARRRAAEHAHPTALAAGPAVAGGEEVGRRGRGAPRTKRAAEVERGEEWREDRLAEDEVERDEAKAVRGVGELQREALAIVQSWKGDGNEECDVRRRAVPDS